MKPIEPGCMALVISAPKHSVQLVGSEVKVISIASIEWQRRGLGRAWIVDSDLVRQCCAQLTSECIVCYPVFLESRLLRIDGYEGRIDIEHTSRFAPSISLDRISECLEKSLRETVEQIERRFGIQRHNSGLLKGRYLDARTEMCWQFVLEFEMQ